MLVHKLQEAYIFAITALAQFRPSLLEGSGLEEELSQDDWDLQVRLSSSLVSSFL